jgi:uncharacterized protein with HEPN domain
MSKAMFLDDGKSQRAVAKSISDIGEAANRIMELVPDTEQRRPEIWKHFVGAYRSRNILVHDYFLVDAEIVWNTIEIFLPQLETLLDAVTQENAGGKEGHSSIAGGRPPS